MKMRELITDIDKLIPDLKVINPLDTSGNRLYNRRFSDITKHTVYSAYETCYGTFKMNMKCMPYARLVAAMEPHRRGPYNGFIGFYTTQPDVTAADFLQLIKDADV